MQLEATSMTMADLLVVVLLLIFSLSLSLSLSQENIYLLTQKMSQEVVPESLLTFSLHQMQMKLPSFVVLRIINSMVCSVSATKR